jgi:hypothetical protein
VTGKNDFIEATTKGCCSHPGCVTFLGDTIYMCGERTDSGQGCGKYFCIEHLVPRLDDVHLCEQCHLDAGGVLCTDVRPHGTKGWKFDVERKWEPLAKAVAAMMDYYQIDSFVIPREDPVGGIMIRKGGVIERNRD